jgi:hypothetical protein
MNEHPDITRDEDAMLAAAFLNRADAALDPPVDPDWADVVRRLGPRRAPSSLKRLILVAAALGLLVAASPPFGLAARLYESVAGSSDSAPPPIAKVDKQLGKLRIGKRFPLQRGQMPRLHAPDIVPGTTRLVDALALSPTRTARLWAAQTKQGGFCFVSSERPFGRGGCAETMPTEAIWTRFSSFQSLDKAGVLRYSHAVMGRVQVAGARTVVVRYADGTRLRAPVSHAWFMAVIPPANARVDKRKATILALDANGTTVASLAVDPPFGKGARATVAMPRVFGGRPTGPSHVVARLTLSPSRTALLLVAPAKTGSLCWRVATTGATDVFWRCGITPLSAPAKLTPAGTSTDALGYQQVTEHLSDGSTFGYAAGWVRAGVARAVLTFQDGRTVVLRTGPGYFLVPIPPASWVAGRRPASITSFDAANHQLSRRSLHPDRHCVYPIADAACGAGRAWWQHQTARQRPSP